MSPAHVLASAGRAARCTLLAAVCLCAAAPGAGAENAVEPFTTGGLLERKSATDLGEVQRAVEARLQMARSRRDPRAELLALRDLLLGFPTAVRDFDMLRDRALVLNKTVGDTGMEATLIGAQAVMAEVNGDHDAAMKLQERAVALAERSGSKDAQVAVFFDYGRLYHRAGQRELALQWYERALSVSTELQEHARQAILLSWIAGLMRLPDSASAKDLAKVEAYLRRGLTLLHPERHRHLIPELIDELGKTYLRQGRLDDARSVWEHAPAQIPDLDFKIGLVDLMQQHPAAAKRRLSQALKDSAGEETEVVARASIALARAEAQLGAPEAAWPLFERARPLVAKLEQPSLQIEFHAGMAEVAERAGLYRQAHGSLQQQFAVERAELTSVNARRMDELALKFDLKLKDADNQLLRARQARSESERTVLMLALGFSAVLVAGALMFLLLQLRQRRRFEVLALKDDLTGAPNRRAMVEHMLREGASAKSAHQALVIGILDIDFFKKVNDVHGHDAGDAVLKAFYRTCSAKLRPQDVLGRWGGEEFVIVTRGTSRASVQALFDRLLEAVGRMEVPALEGQRAITFSMGACLGEPDATPGMERMLTMADEALYAAKEAGRACCRVVIGSGDAEPLMGPKGLVAASFESGLRA